MNIITFSGIQGGLIYMFSLSPIVVRIFRVHQNFRSKIKALNVSYDNEKGCLIVLVSLTEI